MQNFTSNSFTKLAIQNPTIDFSVKKIDGAVYPQGRLFKAIPKWVVVHYTGVANASARGIAKSMNKSTRGASTHYVCDSNDIYSVVDEQHVAWHCGNGAVVQPVKGKVLSLDGLKQYGNTKNWNFALAAQNHINWKNNGGDFLGNSVSFGVDICTIKDDRSTSKVTDTDWRVTPEAVKNTAMVVAYLCKKYNISLDHVIRHCDCTGKPCPRPFVSLSGDGNHTNDDNWISFKDLVNFYLGN